MHKIQLANIFLRYYISPRNLNNNWMTAVIGRFRHVTSWATLRLVGGGIPDFDQDVQNISGMECFF